MDMENENVEVDCDSDLDLLEEIENEVNEDLLAEDELADLRGITETPAIPQDAATKEAFSALLKQRQKDEISRGIPVDNIIPGAGGTLMPESVADGKKIKRDLAMGLYDDIDPESRKKAIELAHERLKKWDVWNIEKNLEKDLITVPGQKYVVISWVGPSFKAKTQITGYRIMGAFKNLEAAQKYAQKANKHEPMFDTGIMEMNLWCFNYPDPSDSVDDNGTPLGAEDAQKKYDNALNKFIVDHKVEREESHQLFETRTALLMRSNVTKEAEMPEELKGTITEDAPEGTVPKGRPTEKMEELQIKEAKKWAQAPALNATQERLREIVRKREELANVEERINEEGEVELDLSPSTLQVHGQTYAAVSYVGHTGTNQRIPLSFKGVYDSKESCEDAIKKLTQMDNTFDILPAPLYCWLPCDPDVSQVQQVHTNERLNTLMEESNNEAQEAMRFHSVVGTHQEEVLDKPFNPGFEGKGVAPWNPSSDILGDEPESTATNVFRGAEAGNIPTFSFQGHAGEAANDLKDVWKGNIGVEELDTVTEQIEQAKVVANEAYKETKKFEQVDQKIQEISNRLGDLMKEGYTEKEAKEMLRVDEGTAVKYSTPNAEDLEKIEKPKVEYKTIQQLQKEQLEIIQEMNNSGKSPKEIREYLAANPVMS